MSLKQQRHAYDWTDDRVTLGAAYMYTLTAVTEAGVHLELATQTVTMALSGAANVTDYALRQNFPHPFNPTTTISFDMPESGFVHLRVFGVDGRLVDELIHGNKPPDRTLMLSPLGSNSSLDITLQSPFASGKPLLLFVSSRLTES